MVALITGKAHRGRPNTQAAASADVHSSPSPLVAPIPTATVLDIQQWRPATLLGAGEWPATGWLTVSALAAIHYGRRACGLAPATGLRLRADTQRRVRSTWRLDNGNQPDFAL